MKYHVKLLSGILLVCLLCVPAMAALPDADRMDELGQRAALIAMDQLKFGKGDPNILVLTNAGRAVVNGQTTERAVSGITKVSGLQNGDNTLWQVKQGPTGNPLVYFYDKKSGKPSTWSPLKPLHTGPDRTEDDSLLQDVLESSCRPRRSDKDCMPTPSGNATMKPWGRGVFVISISNHGPWCVVRPPLQRHAP